MKKITIKKTLIYLTIFILSFIYSFFISTVYNDEFWNYGFSYNISSGLIPYKDFNLIITPLYPMLASLFIKLFGNYLYSLHIFNSITLTSIIYILFNTLKSKSLIIIPLIILNCYPGYNIFSLLIIIIILNLVDKNFKYKDYILGILVGIMFLIKQHIGICLLIPLIYYSKNKFKGLSGFSIPVIILFIYLIYNNALYQFIDYCFLGILDFGKNNSIWLFFPIEAIICLIILYKLIKSNFKNKRLFYILAYQIMTVPIFDDYHFMMGFIPIMYYILLIKNIKKYKIKYYVIISLIFFINWNFIVHDFNELNLYKDNSSYLYGRNIPSYANIDNITNYIKDNKNKYDHIYSFSKLSYCIKLNANYKLDKYDLINNGNMGYKGSSKYIKEVNNYCKENTCLFILNKHEFISFFQTNKEIVDNITKNYKYIDEIDNFKIYSN